jgi:hypothetical protein
MRRRVLLRPVLVLALAACIATALEAAQPATQPPSVKVSLAALNELLTRVPVTPAPLNIARTRARSVVGKLLVLSAKWPAQSPFDYRTNLDRSVRALDRALAGGNVDRMVEFLDALSEDLEVKLEHCVLSGGKLGGSVAVTVRTVRGAEEVRNRQVLYLPKVLELSSSASPDQFPQLSSPTREMLVPGRYVMWSRDPSTNQVSERTVVKVGEGRMDLLLDLPVTSGASR